MVILYYGPRRTVAFRGCFYIWRLKKDLLKSYDFAQVGIIARNFGFVAV